MKIFLIRRRHLILFAGALLAFAVFWVVNAPASVAASVATRQLPIYCVDRDDNVVAISFDAAWGDVRVRHIRNGVAVDWLIRISYHKNAPCYGRDGSITRRFLCCEIGEV